jgi:hypothetical protein
MRATSADGDISQMRLKIVAVTSFLLLSAISAAQGMEMRQKDADDFRAVLFSSKSKEPVECRLF